MQRRYEMEGKHILTATEIIEQEKRCNVILDRIIKKLKLFDNEIKMAQKIIEEIRDAK